MERSINMITDFKKKWWKWSVVVMVLILAVGVLELTKQTLLRTQDRKDETIYGESQTNSRTEVPRIEIILDENGPYWNEGKPIIVTDNKMIDDILTMIDESKSLTDESKLSKMSGMAYKNNKLIAIENDGSKRELTFAFDTLYEIGYIEKDGRKSEPDYSFFRYIADLTEYTNPDTNIESQVVELFATYDWTVDYKINTLKEKLPDNLKHKAGEYWKLSCLNGTGGYYKRVFQGFRQTRYKDSMGMHDQEKPIRAFINQYG